MRLFVLGALQGREAHGYEIKALARLWGVDEWANVGFGSLYHALSALAREGLLAEDAEGQADPRRKATYRVTDAGRAAFLGLLREALRSTRRAEVDLGLAFATGLPPAERVALLGERLATLRRQALDADASLARATTELAHVPWIAASVEHGRALLATEIAWTEDVVGRVASFPPP